MDEVREKESLKKANYIGFAHFYLSRCKNESNSDNQIDKELYSKLVQLDKRLGTRASDQLYECLSHTSRPDIIKV